MVETVTWADILSAAATVVAAGGALWAAREANKSSQSAAKAVDITSKDSEFLTCLKLKERADILWMEYSELRLNNHLEADNKYLEVLFHTEWCCIYFETRGEDISTPIKHFEHEVVYPILKQLRQIDAPAKEVAKIIISNMSDDLTFRSLRNRLLANGFDFDEAFMDKLESC